MLVVDYLFFCAVLSCQQMTIGKIYCAKLIHENYKYLKRKGMPTERVSTRNNNSKIFLSVVIVRPGLKGDWVKERRSKGDSDVTIARHFSFFDWSE